MKKFSDFPLGKKLSYIIAFSSGAALLILATVMVIYETTTYKSRLLQDASTIAELYGLNASAAINFDDPKAATENLATLNTQPGIGRACLYRADGTVLAYYSQNSNTKNGCPTRPLNKEKSHHFTEKSLNYYFPVFYSNEFIGILNLRYDLVPFIKRFFEYGVILIVVSCTLIVVSFLILTGLKKYVSFPVLQLAKTAQRISAKQEYYHRGVIMSKDEMGELTNDFNQMLDTIENSISLHRATLESTADGILVVNTQGKISSYNQNFIELWHLPTTLLDMDTGSEERINQFVLDQLKHPKDYLQKINELHSYPNLESFDILEFKDGRIFERNSRPQRIDQKIVGRVWSFRDVTVRLQTEQSLRQSESRFRRVSDSNMIGIMFSDLHGNITEANDYFLRMIGYTREELNAGLIKWTSLTPPEFQHLDEAAVIGLRQRGVIETYEKEYIAKNGKRIPILLGAALLEGSQTESVAFFLDISERKQAEKERDMSLIQEKKARLDAEKALKVQEDFISIAAHELRTPLTPLKLQNDALKVLIQRNPDFPQAESLSKFIYISDKQIKSLHRLVGQLLDFNHIRTGTLNLVKEKIDFGHLVQKVLEQFQENLTKNKIEMRLHVAEKIIGNWDGMRIEQVVKNLLSNAIKYGKNRPIEISISSNSDIARLVVRDFGIGVPKKDQERIFDRFERASSIDHYGGFGLGLYIAREIILAHRGTISIESEVHQGTTFIVELPLDTYL